MITVQTGQSIQEAVDQSADGDVISLAEGVWYENVKIDKSLTLRGAGQKETVIKGKGADLSVVRIVTPEPKAVSAKVEGLSIREGDWGIWVFSSAQVEITDTNISENGIGILVEDSAQAKITGSTISKNEEAGIELHGSAEVIIGENKIIGNGYGIALENFHGRVLGYGNIIPGPEPEPFHLKILKLLPFVTVELECNRNGAFPEGLEFLMTDRGGSKRWIVRPFLNRRE